MENYNNQFRNKIFDCMSDDIVKSLLPLKILMEALYSACLKDTKNENILYKNLILSIIYLDTYKLYNYKNKVYKLNASEEIVFEKLNVIIEKDFCKELISDKELFQKCVICSYRFAKLPELEKKLAFKCLDDMQNKKLVEKIPNHQLDIETFDTNLNKEYFIEEINKLLKKYNVGIMKYLSDYIKIALKVDEDFIEPIIKEIVKSDYKLTDYMVSEMESQTQYKFELNYKDILDIIGSVNYENFKEMYLLNDMFLKDAIRAFMIINTDYHIVDKEKIINYINNNDYEHVFRFESKQKVKEIDEL